MNKQEVIDKLKAAIPDKTLDDYQRVEGITLNYAVKLVEELGKVTVPQFVADWYEENKDYFEWNLYEFCVEFHKQELPDDLHNWFRYSDNKPIETLVKMKLFGYEVNKGKLYTVEIPIANSPLGYHYVLRKTTSGEIIIDSFFTNNWGNYDYCQLTEEEIKKEHDWAWKYAKEVNNNDD